MRLLWKDMDTAEKKRGLISAGVRRNMRIACGRYIFCGHRFKAPQRGRPKKRPVGCKA
jgi:hypothetical protein